MTLDHNFTSGNSKWSARKDRVLRKEWGRMTLAVLAERLGCRIMTVHAHAKRLGLLRRKEKVAKQT